MIEVACRNAKDYGLTGRAEYMQGSGDQLPLPDASVDAVFTAGSLHEWANPSGTFLEMWRVLRPSGILFLSDLRRDMLLPLKWFLLLSCRPKAIRPGLLTSLGASYTPGELRNLVAGSGLESWLVSSNPLGFTVTGRR